MSDLVSSRLARLVLRGLSNIGLIAIHGDRRVFILNDLGVVKTLRHAQDNYAKVHVQGFTAISFK